MPTSKSTAASPEKVADEAAETVASATDSAIDGVTLNQQRAMETMESAGHAMIEGVTKMQREIVDFVSERIRQDMETQQALLRCRSMDEVRDVQTRFFQTAMDQYSAEAGKLMRIATEVMQRPFDRP